MTQLKDVIYCIWLCPHCSKVHICEKKETIDPRNTKVGDTNEGGQARH
jgi:hypothetical protein